MELPSIEITEEQLKCMRQHYFDLGRESYITKISETRAIKIFKNNPNNMSFDKMFLRMNKQNKLQEIANSGKIKNIVEPTKIFTIDDEIVAYEMTYDDDFIPFNSFNLSTKYKIKYLKALKKQLKYLETKHILYPDLKSDNILLNNKTKKLILCDIDNIVINNYPVDLLPVVLNEFYQKLGMNKLVHSYIHNLFTINVLDGISFNLDSELTELKKGRIPNFISDKEISIIKEMTHLDKNYSGRYLIDSINKTKVK